MRIRELIKTLNLADRVFKPGYPTGRGQYMITEPRRDFIAQLEAHGAKVEYVPCGYDYNYQGMLYTISAK